MTCLKAEYNDLDFVVYQSLQRVVSCWWGFCSSYQTNVIIPSEHPNLCERFRKLTTSIKSMSLLKNSVKRIVPENLQYKLYVMWRGQSDACKDKTICTKHLVSINSLECFGFSHQKKKKWSGLKGQSKEWQIFM